MYCILLYDSAHVCLCTVNIGTGLFVNYLQNVAIHLRMFANIL